MGQVAAAGAIAFAACIVPFHRSLAFPSNKLHGLDPHLECCNGLLVKPASRAVVHYQHQDLCGRAVRHQSNAIEADA